MIRRPPRSTLFPSTPLFRSLLEPARVLPQALAPLRLTLQEVQRGEDARRVGGRSEEHTSELQSQSNLVCRLLLEKKKRNRAGRTCDRRPERRRAYTRYFESS